MLANKLEPHERKKRLKEYQKMFRNCVKVDVVDIATQN